MDGFKTAQGALDAHDRAERIRLERQRGRDELSVLPDAKHVIHDHKRAVLDAGESAEPPSNTTEDLYCLPQSFCLVLRAADAPKPMPGPSRLRRP